MKCKLCKASLNTPFFQKKKTGATYFECKACDFIQLDSQYYYTKQKEYEHYQGHNNIVTDPDYQNFVMPLVEMILSNTNANDLGLDYGCGPGPVVGYLLEQEGYCLSYYDPFFVYNKKVLADKYDFIILSEVAEHFQDPLKEFEKIVKLLKTEGQIFIMTALLDGIKDFTSWHYHRDPTHVSFYSVKSLKKIAKLLGIHFQVSDEHKCIVLSV